MKTTIDQLQMILNAKLFLKETTPEEENMAKRVDLFLEKTRKIDKESTGFPHVYNDDFSQFLREGDITAAKDKLKKYMEVMNQLDSLMPECEDISRFIAEQEEKAGGAEQFIAIGREIWLRYFNSNHPKTNT